MVYLCNVNYFLGSKCNVILNELFHVERWNFTCENTETRPLRRIFQILISSFRVRTGVRVRAKVRAMVSRTNIQIFADEYSNIREF